MLSPNLSGAWTLAMTFPVSSVTLTVSTPSALAIGPATASTAARSFDATAGFDILGARHTTGPDSMTYERPVLAFSDGVGAIAGVAFHGGVLRVNEGLTEAYHGGEAGGPAAILKGAHAPGLEAVELWSALVVDSPGAGAPLIVRP